MKYDTNDSEKQTAMHVAHQMVTAARTAPKGCGVDKIKAFVLDGDDKKELSDEMRKLAVLPGLDFCIRDAINVEDSHCIVLIGVENIPLGLESCGFCGFQNCVNSVKSGSLCAFNTTDLGIAIGSAVSIAADNRVDNRVMGDLQEDTCGIKSGCLFSAYLIQPGQQEENKGRGSPL